MGNSSTETAKKKEESKSPVQAKADAPAGAPSTDAATASKTEDTASKSENASNAEPLAPPPRPGQPVANTPDYFSGAHSHLTFETNPFEHSFASGATSAAGSAAASGAAQTTPGGTKLPSVAALTSPSGILAGVTPGFWGSLRSGPLSPAMLSGPTKEDYFGDGHHLRGGFPTPNESSLRSGLTPGGGGSMFPEPSPSSQALFTQLASGGATPTTLDFHRTALSAAAAQKRDIANTSNQSNITSQPQELANGIEVKPPVTSGQFDQHDANDAANGLFLLAQARNGPQPPTNHYAIAPQLPVHAQPNSVQISAQANETSPSMSARNVNGGSVSTTSGRGASEMSGGYSDDNETKPNTRGKNNNKRGSTSSAQTNGRRKNEETTKGSASKKAKGNSGNAIEPEPPSEDEQEKEDYNNNSNKKMTDEEKRKNFLERNRVAALKCRQRKKQWLANLQQKVEMFSTENDALQVQLSQLREEVVNLKTLLLAHKDCPVTQQQGLQGMSMHQVMDGYAGQMNPYGMAQPMPNQQIIAGQGLQGRRFS